jgi:hypothetical protein
MGRTLLEDMLYMAGYFFLLAVLALLLLIPSAWCVGTLASKYWPVSVVPLFIFTLILCAWGSFRISLKVEKALVKRGRNAVTMLGQLGCLLFLFLMLLPIVLHFLAKR